MDTQPTWAITEVAEKLATVLLELTGTKCPLCERVIVDGEISRPGGCHRRFIARWDLGGAVCERCDIELGPDTARLEAMWMSPNADELVSKYLADRAAQARRLA